MFLGFKLECGIWLCTLAKPRVSSVVSFKTAHRAEVCYSLLLSKRTVCSGLLGFLTDTTVRLSELLVLHLIVIISKNKRFQANYLWAK